MSFPQQHTQTQTQKQQSCPQPQELDSQQQQQQQQQHHSHHHHHHHHHHQTPLPPPLPPSYRYPRAQHPSSASLPLTIPSNTPMSSVGLFSPPNSQRPTQKSISECNTPAAATRSPYLHPLQTHQVRETHKALIDSDNITGRKSINQYEVIEEIGRGVHGKVKLARNTLSTENVAIKIIPRFSKKRRLGKVTAMSPQDKTRKEIAILKKIRHPNVVALLEVIDDPELMKIYMVLEHVELGEIVWRKKGLPHVCLYERRRVEREMRGEAPTSEEEQYHQLLERRQALKELKRARMAQNFPSSSQFWSVEHGAADDASSVGQWSRKPSYDAFADPDAQPLPPLPRSRPASRNPSRVSSRVSSRAPSRTPSKGASSGLSRSVSLSAAAAAAAAAAGVPLACEDYGKDQLGWLEDLGTPVPEAASASSPPHHPLTGPNEFAFPDLTSRARSPSMADSIISHMSSVDYNPREHDPFAEDFSFVPCFTLDQARCAFRDTVLGLEYLHYQGVVHRDIKPANLLWTKDHQVKISDFGVSYFGRPIRDGEPDDMVSESEARDFVDDDLELAKTVGTPAFFAPELCYTDLAGTAEQPKVSEQIDVWSLGVTLYCLIFARIPFLAEDEFRMFKKIATEEVHVSRKRLKPVDPSTSPSATSLYHRQNAHPYRDDNDLEYEEVDNLLHDLLRQMLVKNPEKRIRLRDIKRHPWVVKGLADSVGWLDDTDPARPSCGRRIQVDDKDVSVAVVPLNFLERARSVMKKAVGKVMHHPLVDRSDSRSRRRATTTTTTTNTTNTTTSSAASSAGDSMLRHPGPSSTAYSSSSRRGSIRGGGAGADEHDYFGSQTSSPVTAATERQQPPAPPVDAHGDGYGGVSPYDPMATMLPSADGLTADPAAGSRASASVLRRMNSSRQVRRPQLPPSLVGCGATAEISPRSQAPSSSTPATPRRDGHLEAERPGERCSLPARGCSAAAVAAVAVAASDNSQCRSASVDRALFVSSDKRARARVALSNTVAPGDIPGVDCFVVGPTRSVTVGRKRHARSSVVPSSSLLASPTIDPTTYRHGQPQSDPNFNDRRSARLVDRPETADRPGRPSCPDTSQARGCDVPVDPGEPTTTSDAPDGHHYSVGLTDGAAEQDRCLATRQPATAPSSASPPSSSCPSSSPSASASSSPSSSASSPTDRQAPGFPEPAGRNPGQGPDPDPTPTPATGRPATTKPPSSESLEGIGTPLTSPSETTSPAAACDGSHPKRSSHNAPYFPSHPSLPGLLSGASSISVDMEGELLGKPGVVTGSSPRLDSADASSAHVPAKDATMATSLHQVIEEVPAAESGPLAMRLGTDRTGGDAPSSPKADTTFAEADEDERSDDGLLLMADSSRKRASLLLPPARPCEANVRRDTSVSVGSDETAKGIQAPDGG